MVNRSEEKVRVHMNVVHMYIHMYQSFAQVVNRVGKMDHVYCR